MQKLKRFILSFSFFSLAMSSMAAQSIEMQVYKSPHCGCCSAWVTKMQEAGFSVTVIDQNNNNKLRQQKHIPNQLASCHTALVEGYAIEGHVPSADIARLLKEKPSIAGLAVPGMPASAPGMDIPGDTTPYQVVAFKKEGDMSVYNRY
ncbi:hypothetical protein PCNPT3_04150 [Psychromonas sp. CNPT3]|uniref:DUF411 domain-containing protein n=1 Tax=Psychromonas sp. CNPT3 TaxID=314282 RepID=UPI00006E80BF|nr:DUF411 domain-containing protein [Psychromonas sp. CNPT3]AGH80772.1 hypothetical protein PCNPT3_04150 [Psychromonas sp. CNPT3]